MALTAGWCTWPSCTMLWLLVTMMFVISQGKSTEKVEIRWDYSPQPQDLTCWTCPNKSDNEACNDWAPIKFCSHNHTMCKTVHLIDMRTGRSLLVNKFCSKEEDCTAVHIGCHKHKDSYTQECVSCCGQSFCNELVPANHTSAILLSSLPRASSGRWLHHLPFTIIINMVVIGMTFMIT